MRKRGTNYPKILRCPICGCAWLMYCRDEEWGYGSRDSLYPCNENKLVLFCSRPCMDEYARRLQEKRAAKVMKTTAFKIWWQYDQEYRPLGEIADELGITHDSARAMMQDLETKHWKDLDWILANT